MFSHVLVALAVVATLLVLRNRIKSGQSAHFKSLREFDSNAVAILIALLVTLVFPSHDGRFGYVSSASIVVLVLFSAFFLLRTEKRKFYDVTLAVVFIALSLSVLPDVLNLQGEPSTGALLLRLGGTATLLFLLAWSIRFVLTTFWKHF